MISDRVLFSIDRYDSDGDCTDRCVCLHLQNGVILEFEDANALERFGQNILNMLPEIRSR